MLPSAYFAIVKHTLGVAMLCLVLPLHAEDAASSKPGALEANNVSTAAPPAAHTMRIHYRRKQGDEANWGVYSWEGPKQPSKTWITDRFMFTQRDSFGAWVDIPLAAGKIEIRFLLSNGSGHKNCNTDQNTALQPDIAQRGQEIWITEVSCAIHDKPPASP